MCHNSSDLQSEGLYYDSGSRKTISKYMLEIGKLCYLYGIDLIPNSFCSFTFVDIRAQGRASDGGVYARCSLDRAIQNGVIQLPQDRKPAGFDTALPYCMLGDEAFPLKPYLMRPYPQRVLNKQKRVSFLTCKALIVFVKANQTTCFRLLLDGFL